MLEYFASKRFKNNNDKKTHEREATAGTKSPILNDEDEAFLTKITSEGTPPPLPARPGVILDDGQQSKARAAQTALMDGADSIPLPNSPSVATPADEKPSEEEKKRRNYWSFLPDIPKRVKSKRQSQLAMTLQSAADTVRKGEGVNLKADGTVDESEARKEEQDLSDVLDQLNLSAVNNRVFSFSKESQELLEKFKLVLKDIVNGAPTAYDDLEKLLKGSEKQLDKMYGSLPPFLQTLIKQLPAKMTAALGPEVLAAAAEKPGYDASHLNAESSHQGSRKKSKRGRVPSLKSLVSEQGAVAAMLRSILNFLKLRFPAIMTGTNVLMSLAVFILLFVFWYCHKRGRETRLEKEAAARSSETDLDESIVLEPGTKPDGHGPPGDNDVEPAIRIHADPAVDDKPSATVADLPSVLNLPDPQTVPLPEHADQELYEDEGMEAKIPK